MGEIHRPQDFNSIVRPWPRPESMLTNVIKMDREKMGCNNTTGRRGGVVEGRGLGWFELTRQSLPPGLLLVPACCQGVWPSSHEPSLHDVVINVLGYRAILSVCSLSSLCQQSGGESCTGLESHMEKCRKLIWRSWRHALNPPGSEHERNLYTWWKNKWENEIKKSIEKSRSPLWHRGDPLRRPGCWDKLSLSAAVPPESFPGCSRLPRNSWGAGEAC